MILQKSFLILRNFVCDTYPSWKAVGDSTLTTEVAPCCRCFVRLSEKVGCWLHSRKHFVESRPTNPFGLWSLGCFGAATILNIMHIPNLNNLWMNFAHQTTDLVHPGTGMHQTNAAIQRPKLHSLSWPGRFLRFLAHLLVLALVRTPLQNPSVRSRFMLPLNEHG